ncbi:hypothetical protein ACO0LG_20425 [Undibacterium sp. Ji42W]|uniref:hypothetical protein n=1 Tax=Undibacterium sp. Ji42W TaxID=3413039 RepID=UPI003BF09F80
MILEISNLKQRMSEGGNWQSFHDEITALHTKATTEEEYVILLEAHAILVELSKSCFDDATYRRLLPIIASEYLLLLNKEATQNGLVNSNLLERITRREVETGRLDPNDEFRKLAVAGEDMIGKTSGVTAHKCKHGDWFFYGMSFATILVYGLEMISWSPLWLIVIGLVAGWKINERERSKIKNLRAH